MSTIAYPRSVPSGPSGKTVAGFLVGAVLAVAVGYGVVTLGEPVSGQLSHAAAVARGEHMQAINELGFGESAANGADQLSIQRAAELAAEQAALARTERMLEINSFGAELAATEEARRRGERMLEINSIGWEPARLENGGPRPHLPLE